jgi:hypothetical protein
VFQRWVQFLCYFDLTTGDKPSFSKFVCVAILVAAIAQSTLTLGVIIALLAASFGRSVFLAFLNRTSVRVNDENARLTAEHRVEIIERRDMTLGVEPTP